MGFRGLTVKGRRFLAEALESCMVAQEAAQDVPICLQKRVYGLGFKVSSLGVAA